jgi:hypothetical protein
MSNSVTEEQKDTFACSKQNGETLKCYYKYIFCDSLKSVQWPNDLHVILFIKAFDVILCKVQNMHIRQ